MYKDISFETLFIVMDRGSMSVWWHQGKADSNGANRKSWGHGELTGGGRGVGGAQEHSCDRRKGRLCWEQHRLTSLCQYHRPNTPSVKLDYLEKVFKNWTSSALAFFCSTDWSFDVHGSVHRNVNLIERTNKMQPCSKIYYSNVS
jgi:hypothetical protein